MGDGDGGKALVLACKLVFVVAVLGQVLPFSYVCLSYTASVSSKFGDWKSIPGARPVRAVLDTRSCPIRTALGGSNTPSTPAGLCARHSWCYNPRGGGRALVLACKLVCVVAVLGQVLPCSHITALVTMPQ